MRWIRDRRFPVCNEHEEFYRVAGFIEDITERKSAEERLAVEHAVTRALAELVAVPDTSKKILQIFCQSFQWGIGELWLVDPASHVLRCIEIWYPPSAEFKEFASSRRQMTFSPRIGLVGQIQPGNVDPGFRSGPKFRASGDTSAVGFALSVRLSDPIPWRNSRRFELLQC